MLGVALAQGTVVAIAALALWSLLVVVVRKWRKR